MFQCTTRGVTIALGFLAAVVVLLTYTADTMTISNLSGSKRAPVVTAVYPEKHDKPSKGLTDVVDATAAQQDAPRLRPQTRSQTQSQAQSQAQPQASSKPAPAADSDPSSYQAQFSIPHDTYCGSSAAVERLTSAIESTSIPLTLVKTGTVPEFDFSCTDVEHDNDVSKQVRSTGGMEIFVTYMWSLLLRDAKAKRPDSTPFVIDVGGNMGWYTMFSAVMGARVLTFEPVPVFQNFIMHNLARLPPNQCKSVSLIPRVVAPTSGNYSVRWIASGLLGAAGIDGLNMGGKANVKTIQVAGALIDDVVPADTQVDILKADVEGFEPEVLRSATNLIDGGKVDNIIVEWSPGIAKRKGTPSDPTAGTRDAVEVCEWLRTDGANRPGYEVTFLTWNTVKSLDKSNKWTWKTSHLPDYLHPMSQACDDPSLLSQFNFMLWFARPGSLARLQKGIA